MYSPFGPVWHVHGLTGAGSFRKSQTNILFDSALLPFLNATFFEVAKTLKVLHFLLCQLKTYSLDALDSSQATTSFLFRSRLRIAYLPEALREVDEIFKPLLNAQLVLLPAFCIILMFGLGWSFNNFFMLTAEHLFIGLIAKLICAMVHVPGQMVEYVTDYFRHFVHEF